MARRPTVSQRVQIAALIKTWQPVIQKAFLDAMQAAADRVDVTLVIAALDRGDFARVDELLRIDNSVLFPLDDALRGTYLTGAALAAPTLPRSIAGSFAFNGRHPRAEAWISRHGADLVQGIVDDSLAATRAVIMSGLTDGRTTRQVALDIVGRLEVSGKRSGGILGLTSEQTNYTINARRILSSPDTMGQYFVRDRKTGKMKPRYALSDRRFDARIKRAILTGKPLPATEIDQIMQAHKSKALKARGKLIAENETFTAQAAGREEAFRQTLERDEVETVTVRWQHNLSLNARPDHQAMDGTVIEFGQTFNFPDAAMKHPHDPAGGAKHSAGCRCIAVYRVRLKRD